MRYSILVIPTLVMLGLLAIPILMVTEGCSQNMDRTGNEEKPLAWKTEWVMPLAIANDGSWFDFAVGRDQGSTQYICFINDKMKPSYISVSDDVVFKNFDGPPSLALMKKGMQRLYVAKGPFKYVPGMKEEK